MTCRKQGYFASLKVAHTLEEEQRYSQVAVSYCSPHRTLNSPTHSTCVCVSDATCCAGLNTETHFLRRIKEFLKLGGEKKVNKKKLGKIKRKFFQTLMSQNSICEVINAVSGGTTTPIFFLMVCQS